MKGFLIIISGLFCLGCQLNEAKQGVLVVDVIDSGECQRGEEDDKSYG